MTNASDNGGKVWPSDPVDRIVMLALWSTCHPQLDEPVLSEWLSEVGNALLGRLDREALAARLRDITFVGDTRELEQVVFTAAGGAPRWTCMHVVVYRDRQSLVDMDRAVGVGQPAEWREWVERVTVDDLRAVFPAAGASVRVRPDIRSAPSLMAPAPWEWDDGTVPEGRRIVVRALQSALQDSGQLFPDQAVTWSKLAAAAPGVLESLPAFVGIVRDKGRLFEDDTLRWVNRSSRWRGLNGRSGMLREIDVSLANECVGVGPRLVAALRERQSVFVEVASLQDEDPALDDELYLRRELLRCAVDLAAAFPPFARDMAAHGPITLRTISAETGWGRKGMRDLMATVRLMPRLGVPRKELPKVPEGKEAEEETDAQRAARLRQTEILTPPPASAPLRTLWEREHFLVACPVPGKTARELLALDNLAVLMRDEADRLWPGYSRVVGTAAVF